jgi:hypothetical protein
MRSFLKAHFGLGPLSTDVENIGSEASQQPEKRQRPIGATFRLGTALLEYSQPRDRAGWHYDVIRRNLGFPAVSHVAWTAVDIDARRDALDARGVDVFEHSVPSSPHGTYRVINILPEESTRGVWFQLAENIEPVHGDSYRHGSDDQESEGRDEASGITHVHHVTYRLWGLESLTDFIGEAFGVSPIERQKVATDGVRQVAFRFGRTLAYFTEPIGWRRPGPGPGGIASGVCDGRVTEVGWAVPDLGHRAESLSASGVRFVEEQPVSSADGSYRFLHTAPDLAGGYSFQLCESADV